MTPMTAENHVLKIDTRGRVRVPAERRESLLDEFERSGLSGMKFAELSGVKYPTFAIWVQKRRKAREADQRSLSGTGTETSGANEMSPPIRFFEAICESEPISEANGSLKIELPGGAVMRMETLTQVRLGAELLRLLTVKGGLPC